MTVFFEAQLLGVNEVPHRPVVDLEAALGKFGHKTAQSELSLPDPLRQKGVMTASSCRRRAKDNNNAISST
jgi:hypothetical protein